MIIWHIFKKDLKLLWPLLLIVAAVHAMNATMWVMTGTFGEPASLRRMASQFIIVVVVGIMAPIAMAVHQDVLPGDRQDWLVRPIRRRDLILAKLLFVLLAVHGPILLVDFAQGMAMGFTPWYSLCAALSRGVYLLVSVSLPVLGLATVTSTIIEFVGGFLAIILVLVALILLVTVIAPNGGTNSFVGRDSWLMLELWSAVGLAAAIIVIPLQYLRRKTMLARCIAAGALGVLILV
jgi:hypothetical protein